MQYPHYNKTQMGVTEGRDIRLTMSVSGLGVGVREWLFFCFLSKSYTVFL